MPLLDDRAVRALVREHSRDCGRRVTERRQALGLNQSQVAELAGVTQQTISHIEVGLKSPRDQVKVTIAAALSCAVEDLWPAPDRQRIAAILRETAA